MTGPCIDQVTKIVKYTIRKRKTTVSLLNLKIKYSLYTVDSRLTLSGSTGMRFTRGKIWEHKCFYNKLLSVYFVPQVRNIMPVFMGMTHSPASTLYTRDRNANYHCNLCAKSGYYFHPFLLPFRQATRMHD